MLRALINLTIQFIVLTCLFFIFPVAPALALGTETLKPTAFTDTSGAWNNEASAYDGATGGEDTTAATTSGLSSQGEIIVFHTWATPGESHSSRNLFIRRACSGISNDTWDIEYSTNGGSGWTPIETGNGNVAKGNTTAISIDTGLDLTNLQVRLTYNKSAGWDGPTIEVYDIWLECIFPDISNTPNYYDFGLLEANSSYNTGLTHFTVTNNSDFNVNITIGSTDMTGGNTWTLSDSATPGSDTYGLRAGREGDGGYTIIVKRNSPYNTLVSNLASSGTQRWGLEMLSPTTFTDSAQKSGIITITATQA